MARDRGRRRGGRDRAAVDRDTERVFMDLAMILELVAKTPSSCTLHAPSPDNDRDMGGNAINVSMVASAPNCSRLDRGCRVGTFGDFKNFVRLGHMPNICHQSGGVPVEPRDIPAETRHLDALYAFLTLTDKPPYVYALGRQRIEDGLDMMAIRFGTDRDGMRDKCALHAVINTSSPPQVDGPMPQGLMAQGLMALAENNQATAITPFTLAGAMSPATLAGALVMQMMGEILQPLVVNDDTLAFEAIREVGHGGHFFGVDHTLERYETAFYAPILSDWRTFESWREAGAADAKVRVNPLWKKLLTDYQPPPLDPAVDEALVAHVARARERLNATQGAARRAGRRAGRGRHGDAGMGEMTAIAPLTVRRT